MEEIAADFSYETVRLSDRVLSWTWNRLYQGINVTNAERACASWRRTATDRLRALPP